MKLWLISQCENNDYDTYDSAVVADETIEEARNTHPSVDFDPNDSDHYSWCKFDKVNVVYIGVAKEGMKPGVICASFNAG